MTRISTRLHAEGRTLHIEDDGYFADTLDFVSGDEDARRLAACWNFCLGIPTEMLTEGYLAETEKT